VQPAVGVKQVEYFHSSHTNKFEIDFGLAYRHKGWLAIEKQRTTNEDFSDAGAPIATSGPPIATAANDSSNNQMSEIGSLQAIV